MENNSPFSEFESWGGGSWFSPCDHKKVADGRKSESKPEPRYRDIKTTDESEG